MTATTAGPDPVSDMNFWLGGVSSTDRAGSRDTPQVRSTIATWL